MTEIDRKEIETAAGTYTVRWLSDEFAGEPEDEGFGLLTAGNSRQISIEAGDVPAEVARAFKLCGGDRNDLWEWETRSGAALVRWLTLKGFKGVTLVDDSYRPVEASTKRHYGSVYGVAWAPEDATEPEAYVRSQLEAWRAWAEGDTFGYVVTGPDGNEIDALWGYYGFLREQEYTLDMATDAINDDAAERLKGANTVGAGFVGVI